MPHTLHLGPLRNESLALLQAQDSESLLLITPDEPTQQTIDLRNTLPKSEARMGLISIEGTSVTWYRYSLPGFDSQSPATGLKDLYPGLQFEGTESRDTESLQALVDELTAGDGLPERLILEQPEQALSLLQGLDEAGVLAQLAQLDIRSATQPLYEGMATQAQLIYWCEQLAGLELQGQQADDPELPLLHFKRHPLFQTLQEVRQALLQMTERLSAEQDNAAGLAKERDALSTERDTLKQQRDEEAKAKEAAQTEHAQLKKERDTLKQQCDEEAKAKETVQAEHAELKQERDTLKQQCDEEAKAKETVQAEHAELKQERETLKRQRDEQAKAKETVQAEYAQLKKECDTLKQQRDEQAKAKETAQAEHAELKKERDTLKQQRDEQAKAKETAQAEHAKLKKERDTLKQQLDELTKAKEAAQAESGKLKEEHGRLQQQRDEQAKVIEAAQGESTKLKALAEDRLSQLNEDRQQLSRLKTVNQQLEHRQHAIQEEMVKAEAQLDLIKNWVLRESSL